MLGEENTYLYRTSLYLAASASAEFFADIALSPMESVKVRIQTSEVGTFPTTLREAAPKIYAAEGLNGFYKSLVPLWGRQIPYTMMKFACFERTVEALYQYVVPKPRAECSKGEQLIVTFAAGYIAGGKPSLPSIWRVFFEILIFLLVFCAIVSHPADTVVSYMNKSQGSTVGSAAKALGFKGMWAGLGPRIVMIGTLTALQWFIYDFVKVTLRLPRPPPPAVRFYFLLPFKNNKECMKWWYSLCELEFPSILWWVLSITIICALGYKKSCFSIFIWSSFSFRCPSHWRKSLALSNSNLKIDINNLDWGGKHFKI